MNKIISMNSKLKNHFSALTQNMKALAADTRGEGYLDMASAPVSA